MSDSNIESELVGGNDVEIADNHQSPIIAEQEDSAMQDANYGDTENIDDQLNDGNIEENIVKSAQNETNHTTREIDAILRNQATIKEMADNIAKEEQRSDGMNDNNKWSEESDSRTSKLENRLCQTMFIILLMILIAFFTIFIIQKWEHEKMQARTDAFWKHVTKSATILHESYAESHPKTVREACLHALRHRSIVSAYKSGGIDLKIEDSQQRIAVISAVVEQCRIKLESTDSYQKYAQTQLPELLQITHHALNDQTAKQYPAIKAQFERDQKRWQEEQIRRQ